MSRYTEVIAKIHVLESESLVVCEFCEQTVHPVQLYTRPRRGYDRIMPFVAVNDYLCRTCAFNVYGLLYETSECDDEIAELNRQMRTFKQREKVAYRKVCATVWAAA